MGPQKKPYVIVPVKRLRDSKSRLSKSLSKNERETLSVLMLEDVMTQITSSKLVTEILFVTPDEQVIRIAKTLGVDYLYSDSGDLNVDLGKALARCVESGAESAMIILADLPTLLEKDISQIVQLSSNRPNAVIAPSKDGGTNILLVRPCDLVTPSFGLGSFEKHMRQLTSLGVEVKVYRSDGASNDIDSIEDVRDLLEKGNMLSVKPKSLLYLEKLKLSNHLKV